MKNTLPFQIVYILSFEYTFYKILQDTATSSFFFFALHFVFSFLD